MSLIERIASSGSHEEKKLPEDRGGEDPALSNRIAIIIRAAFAPVQLRAVRKEKHFLTGSRLATGPGLGQIPVADAFGLKFLPVAGNGVVEGNVRFFLRIGALCPRRAEQDGSEFGNAFQAEL
ncbi:hypothetical protein VSU19_18440 [Verrucomicrobiales bacterium BCK34]|nr:hypothetical protein [Verrucomicrobiales bacterium BCK34]